MLVSISYFGLGVLGYSVFTGGDIKKDIGLILGYTAGYVACLFKNKKKSIDWVCIIVYILGNE